VLRGTGVERLGRVGSSRHHVDGLLGEGVHASTLHGFWKRVLSSGPSGAQLLHGREEEVGERHGALVRANGWHDNSHRLALRIATVAPGPLRCEVIDRVLGKLDVAEE
jgi:hypothetical protein